MVCRIRVLFFCGDGLRGRGSGADLEKYGGEVHCAKHCDEPLKAKIVSAMASTIFESHLRSAKCQQTRLLQPLPLVFQDKTEWNDL